MTNPVMDPKWYARVTGFALAATALLGIVMEMATDGDFIAGFLEFDWTHDILHVVLAAAAIGAGFAAGGSYAQLYAKIFGVVYTGLAVAGFIAPDLLSFLGVHLELGENLVHLVIGGWGIVTGFFGATGGPRPTAGPRRGV